MIINQNNFDWTLTNRKLVIYIPNFGRKNYLEITLKRFCTKANNNDWCFLVANDGIHEDMSDLTKKYNLFWFTLERENQKERNGCIIRNYIIDNVQSEWLATRDPEIFLESKNEDYISKLLKLKENIVYRPRYMIELNEIETQKLLNNPLIKSNSLSILRKWDVIDNKGQAFHNGCCIKTKTLKALGGYDKSFENSYGYEDWFMLHKLKKLNLKFHIDSDVCGYHIFHPRMRSFHRTITLNEAIYNRKRKND